TASGSSVEAGPRTLPGPRRRPRAAGRCVALVLAAAAAVLVAAAPTYDDRLEKPGDAHRRQRVLGVEKLHVSEYLPSGLRLAGLGGAFAVSVLLAAAARRLLRRTCPAGRTPALSDYELAYLEHGAAGTA